MTKEKTSHLVAIIQRTFSYHSSDLFNKFIGHLLVDDGYGATDPENPDGWYLFNDFSVRSIDEGEALSFPGSWKIPTILYFERVGVQSQLDFSSLPSQVDHSILSQDTNISV